MSKDSSATKTARKRHQNLYKEENKKKVRIWSSTI